MLQLMLQYFLIAYIPDKTLREPNISQKPLEEAELSYTRQLDISVNFFSFHINALVIRLLYISIILKYLK